MFFYTSSPHPVKIVWGSTSLRLFYCKGLLCSLFKTRITLWGCQAPDPANCITSDLRFNHITTRPFSCFCIIFFLSQFFNTCIISFLIWYFDPPHVGKLLVTLTFSFLLSSYHFLLWGYLKMWCNILQWIIQHPPQTWHLSHRNLLVLAKYSDLDRKCYPIYHQYKVNEMCMKWWWWWWRTSIFRPILDEEPVSPSIRFLSSFLTDTHACSHQ